MKIAILGAGVFGTALGGILANKGYDIDYYDSKIERELLKNVTGGAKIIVLAVPSSVVPYLIPHLPKDKTLVVATKGFLNDSLFCEFKDYAVISGPGFANDIKSHCTIKLTTTSQEIAEMFGTDFLSFDITDDKKGVLMCGSLKNVYAILAGYLNLKPDTANYDNFIHDVVKEMKQILKINGARPETVDLACGVADLKITCYYPSRNYEFGQKVRKNNKYIPEDTVEGITVIKKIKRGDIIIPNDMYNLSKILEVSEKWG